LASYSGDDIFLFNLKETLPHDWKSPEMFRQSSRKRKRDEGDNGDEEEYVDQQQDENMEYVNPQEYYVQRYSGHCNIRTVKGVSFFGPQAEYVASGSDDGRIFIWEKNTSRLVNMMKGDRDVVNVISGHPFDCVMATSGIENHVKIWEPILEAPADLKQAEDIARKNRQNAQSRSERNVIPLALIRQLIRVNSLHGQIDNDDDDVDEGSEEGGESDQEGVECLLQ